MDSRILIQIDRLSKFGTLSEDSEHPNWELVRTSELGTSSEQPNEFLDVLTKSDFFWPFVIENGLEGQF